MQKEIKYATDERPHATNEFKTGKNNPRKFRKNQVEKLQRAALIDPRVIPRSGPGRPRLNSTQSGLFQAIVSVVTADENMLAAYPRRRSEQLRSYKRLDDLSKLKA